MNSALREPCLDREVAAQILESAIHSYSFPLVYFDFERGEEQSTKNIRELEEIIADMLHSHDPQVIRYGLANILYWGHANAGYRMHRVETFLAKVTYEQIEAFQSLLAKDEVPTLKELRQLKMPQYSGISFLSKILAFLSPQTHAVLDLLLSRMATPEGSKAIDQLKVTTQIVVTASNSAAYYRWCVECEKISREIFSGKYRVDEIECLFSTIS